MRAIYVDKNIPRVLLAKAVVPIWPDFVWTPLSATRAGILPGPRWLRVKNIACGICATDLSLLFVKADSTLKISSKPSNYLPGIRGMLMQRE